MSGKDNKELKNTSLGDSRLPIVAVKPLQFGHHAAANETGINFSSLTWGAQDTIDTDISNPSASDILNAHLSIYKAGVSIHSSAKGKLSPLAYRINSTGIIWKNFVTEADEIFTITANNTWRTSLQCVDADVLNATGTLAANATEIDFVKVIKLPRTGQPCPLIVMIDESPKYMNTNNSTSNLDGDFYIKDLGNGFGRSIVLNSSATVARNYQITGAGVIPQSAEASVLQKIETLSSKIDVIVPDLALATGNPESKYQTAPSSVDLAYFGNIVTQMYAQFVSKIYSFIKVTGQAFSAQQTTITPTGTTATINWNNGNSVILDLHSATGNVTVTLVNPNAGASYIIKIIQSATPRTITWSPTPKWPGGNAGVLTTTNDAVDMLGLYYDGTSYYANLNNNFV